MLVRFATEKDTVRIIRAIQNKKMEYNTTANVKIDIEMHRLVVIEDNGKLLGSCAIVEEKEYSYTAIKRVCVYSKKSQGKGVASQLINFVVSLNLGTIGATPWDDNPAMIHVFEKFGFTYQYTFMKHYCFYKKEA